MKKWSIYKLVVIPILLTQNNLIAQELQLLKKTHLADYPSASAIEFYKDRLYVAGDDATNILILDTNHKVLDSVALFASQTKRISKKEKADLEASTIVTKEGENYLVVLSSFSTKRRNKMVVMHLDNEKKKPQIITSKEPGAGVKELNIEGATHIKGQLVLSNRANNTHKNNHLILSHLDLTNGIEHKNHRSLTVVIPKKDGVSGLSALTYIEDKDLLLFTASTENTTNAHTDGSIGESYVGYISNISKKMNQDSVHADSFIPLTNFFESKAPQKIEAIAVEKTEGTDLTLHLASDNDNGESTLFKMKLSLDNIN